jgi:serine/threonine-protein kinase
MATVYLARDLKHGREVAIKVLHPDLAAVIGADRFLAEIRTTAQLQHPHILPLFDSGAANGYLYYVMPYLAGGTLRELVERSAPIPPAEVARLVTEVGGALDYAHRQGVIHRDIKPANILLHDGSALLADFGIARAITASGADRLTETGISVGTPSYMSPEQAGGEREIGPASDVYSLGVVVYEMLSGQVPFVGATAQAVIAQLFTVPPAPLHTRHPAIPKGVDGTVLKALAKAPEERFATAGAFAAALQGSVDRHTVRVSSPAEAPRPAWHRRALVAGALVLAGIGVWWGTGRHGGSGAARGPRLLAVLPFTNESRDSAMAFFGTGLSVEVTDELHRLGVEVVGSSAAALAAHRFRSGDGVDIQAVGRSVGADAVLDGSILEATRGRRVSLQLTDVKRQVVLWSETYQLGGDLFGIQDSVAREVARALQVTLTPSQFAQIQRGRSDDPLAHELVVRAKGYGEQRSEEGLTSAIGLYQEALRRDSTYVDAWAGLAEAYNLRAVFSRVVPRDYFRLATVATDRALALDTLSAAAHRSRAFLAVFYTHDWAEGKAEFDRTLALDSLAAGSWLFRAWYFSAIGETDSMLASMRRARALDSLTPIYPVRLADALYWTGNDSAAERELVAVLQRDPTNAIAQFSLAPVYARLGQCKKALATIPETAPSNFASYSYLVRTWARCGRLDRVRTFLQEEERSVARGGQVSGVVLGVTSTYLGDKEGMYRWLRYAVRTGDWEILFINSTTEFDPFRSEPRFQAVLREAGLPVH